MDTHEGVAASTDGLDKFVDIKYVWNIQDLQSALLLEGKQTIFSPEISQAQSPHKWHLEYRHENNGRYFTVYLVWDTIPMDDNPRSFFTKGTAVLREGNNTVQEIGKYKKIASEEIEVIRYNGTYNMDGTILSNWDKLNLEVVCEIIYFGRMHIPSQDAQNFLLESLYRDDQKDFILAVGDEEVKIHKCILTAQSNVLHKILRTDMKESQSGRWEIKDMSYETVQELVRFFYLKKLSDDLDNHIKEELLSAADKHNLKDLLLACQSYLIEDLNKENALKMLSLACKFSALKLQKAAANMFT